MLVRSRLIALKFCYMCRQTEKEKKGITAISYICPQHYRLVAHIYGLFLLLLFKRKEADLVYAQLAEFDHETDSAKPPKPPNYEPTVYADVEEMPPELPGREDPDCSQPTYANLETTGV